MDGYRLLIAFNININMVHTEVRIGNLVEYDNRIFKIHTIAKEFPTLNTEEFGIRVVGWNDLKPIKITKDWLLKLGFEYEYNPKHNNNNWFKNGDISIYCNPTDKNYPLKVHSKSMCYSKVMHIHELQNLFFFRGFY